ncbi:MAG: MFS transporter [Streptosporangiaceae bacterium]
MAVSGFMVTLDNTVTNNAAKTLVDVFHTSSGAVSWVATSYILMFSCLMIAGGRLVDVYGPRITFVSGMTIFTLSSLGAGLSDDLSQLIICRVLQGAGSAIALPATLVAITVDRTDKQRSQGNLVYILVASTASAVGPAVGGLIIDTWSWHWIFLINVLPGALAVVLGLTVLRGQREGSPEGLDLPAVLTSATLLFAVTYAISAGGSFGWTDPAVIGVFVLAAMSLLSFILVEKWAPNPMISTEFFRNKIFVGGLIGQILWGIGFSGVLYYASQFIQNVLHYSPSQAGLFFIPPAVIIGVVTPLGFWLTTRFGPRIPVTTGLVLMAAGMLLFSRVREGAGFIDLAPGITLIGVGSALMMPLGMFILKSVAEDRAGVAGGLLNVGREVSAALGIVVLGVVFNSLTQHARLNGTSIVRATERASSAALMLGAGLVLIGALVVFATMPAKKDIAATEPVPEPLVPTPEYARTTSSGTFPIIPEWWGSNAKSGIPSAWPPPPSHSPYELSSRSRSSE